MRVLAILASLAAASADGAVKPFFLQSASDIASLDELDQWKAGAQADILQLPQDRQSLMLMSLEREYKQRLSQIGTSDAAATESQLPSFLVLESAHRYHTMEELQAWNERQIVEIKKNVPSEYQHYGFDSVQKEFGNRKAALEQQVAGAETSVTSLAAMDLPVLKLNAEEFTSIKELDAWHSEQLDQIKKFVPKGYRSFATDAVEAEYKSRAEQFPAATEAAVEPQEAVQPVFLRSASNLDTEAELKAWLVEEQHHIQKEVPEEHRQFMLDSVHGEYEQRLRQFSGEGAGRLPAFLVLESAHRYHTLTELEAWRARQVDHIRRNVPFEYQQVGLDSAEAEYRKRKAQLEQSAMEAPGQSRELPVLMLTAEEFQNKIQLDGWREQQKATIDKYVPENYRKYAVQSIDREYEKRRAALEESNSTAAEESNSIAAGESNGTAAEESNTAAEAENSSARLEALELVEEEDTKEFTPSIVLAVGSMIPMSLFVAAAVAKFRRQRPEGADEPLLAEDNA